MPQPGLRDGRTGGADDDHPLVVVVVERQALDQVRAAVTLARRTARGPGRLTVAVKPDGDAGLLATALPAFEALIGHCVAERAVRPRDSGPLTAERACGAARR